MVTHMSSHGKSTGLIEHIDLIESIFRRLMKILREVKTLRLEALISREHECIDFYEIGAIRDYFKNLCMLLELWSEAEYWRELIRVKVKEIDRKYKEYELSGREWMQKQDELSRDIDRLEEFLEIILEAREALCGKRTIGESQYPS